jgi:membrane protease YdiL (CAAX protease family)
MPDTAGKTWREIAVFLAFLVGLSALCDALVLRSANADERLGLAMLAPGLAAVATYLLMERSLRPVGWRPGRVVYLLLGLAIPLGYCLVEYGLAWAAGWGRYNGQWPAQAVIYIGTLLFNATLSALLEEVGWRGLLVPKLARVTGFAGVVAISGLIWAVWHYPLIILSHVRPADASLAHSLACFTVFVMGVGAAAAWLRLKSGSVWPAALLHGSHNAFMLYVFNPLTSDAGGTWRLLGEYGLVSALVGVALLIVFWLLRRQLPVAAAADAAVPTV